MGFHLFFFLWTTSSSASKCRIWSNDDKTCRLSSMAASLLRHMRGIIQIRQDKTRRDEIGSDGIRWDQITSEGRGDDVAVKCSAVQAVQAEFGLKEILAWIHKLHSKDTYESSGQQKPCDACKCNTCYGCDDITVKEFTTRHITHTRTHTQNAATGRRAEQSTKWVLHVNEALQCCSMTSAACVCVVKLQGLKADYGHLFFFFNDGEEK